MYGGRQAVDADTGRALSADEAERAACNPLIYKWVRWIEVAA